MPVVVGIIVLLVVVCLRAVYCYLLYYGQNAAQHLLVACQSCVCVGRIATVRGQWSEEHDKVFVSRKLVDGRLEDVVGIDTGSNLRCFLRDEFHVWMVENGVYLMQSQRAFQTRRA